MLNLIARIVEGKNAKFIMSSAQNRKTTDRVYIFRILGNCDDVSPRASRQVRFILTATSLVVCVIVVEGSTVEYI